MTRQRSAARLCALVLAGLTIAGCSGSGSDRAARAPTSTRPRPSTSAPSTTVPAPGPTTVAGPAPTLAPFTDDARAEVDVALTGSVHLRSTFAKPDGCQSGAPKLPSVVLVIANAIDGSRIRFSPSLPVAGTFTLGDPAAASSLEGLVLEVAGTAGTQLSAPQSGVVTFEDAQARAGHFRVTGLQSTNPAARGEVLDVSWKCG